MRANTGHIRCFTIEIVISERYTMSAHKLPKRTTFSWIIIVTALHMMLVISYVPAELSAAEDRMIEQYANYMPEDTIIYAAVNSSDDLINDLDALYSDVVSGLIRIADIPPSQLGLPESVPAILDTMVQEATYDYSTDFQTMLRPWLGDTIAIGVGDNYNALVPDMLIVIDITSRQAAVDFIESNLGPGFEEKETDGYTIFSDEDEDAYFAVTETTLFLGTNPDILPVDGKPQTNLGSNEAFVAMLDKLPEDNYDVLLYLADSSLILDEMNMDGNQPDVLSMQLSEIMGPLVIAGTLQDKRTFIMDILADIDLAQLAGTVGPDYQPLNASFWKRIPADTTLMLHGTNLETTYDGLMALIALSDPSAGGQIAQLEAATSTIGLDFREDIIGWMDGDYALTFSYTVGPDNLGFMAAAINPGAPIENLGISFGLMVEVTDSQKAQELVNTLALLLNLGTGSDDTVNVTREEIGNANAIIVSANFPEGNFGIDLVIGANDDVFVMGTRDHATTALTGSGQITQNPLFNTAQSYLLDDTVSFTYFDHNFVVFITDMLVVLGPSIEAVFQEIILELGSESLTEPAPRPTGNEILTQLRMSRRIAALFDSMTYGMSTDGNTQIMRFVLTMAE
jgi:hypothetical protein